MKTHFDNLHVHFYFSMSLDCIAFRNEFVFYGEGLLAPRPRNVGSYNSHTT
jgi:hypothetical protein